MKKFIVKDEDGNQLEVTEEEISEAANKPADEPEVKDDDTSSLTPDEIQALKSLAAIAPQLTALVGSGDETSAEDEGCEENILNPEDEDEDEEIIDTDEDNKAVAHDSKKSFGAIEKKKTADSADVEEDVVSSAWAKRFGGIK